MANYTTSDNVFVKKILSFKDFVASLKTNKNRKNSIQEKICYKGAVPFGIINALIPVSFMVYDLFHKFDWAEFFCIPLIMLFVGFLSGSFGFLLFHISTSIYIPKEIKKINRENKENFSLFIQSLNEVKNKEDTLKYFSYLKEHHLSTLADKNYIDTFSVEFIKNFNEKNHDYLLQIIQSFSTWDLLKRIEYDEFKKNEAIENEELFSNFINSDATIKEPETVEILESEINHIVNGINYRTVV